MDVDRTAERRPSRPFLTHGREVYPSQRNGDVRARRGVCCHISGDGVKTKMAGWNPAFYHTAEIWRAIKLSREFKNGDFWPDRNWRPHRVANASGIDYSDFNVDLTKLTS